MQVSCFNIRKIIINFENEQIDFKRSIDDSINCTFICQVIEVIMLGQKVSASCKLHVKQLMHRFCQLFYHTPCMGNSFLPLTDSFEHNFAKIKVLFVHHMYFLHTFRGYACFFFNIEQPGSTVSANITLFFQFFLHQLY